MMFRNACRMTALAALALGLITTAVPASASATGDNSNASVWGPQEGWLPAFAGDIPCPLGAICLYKDQTYFHFVLPHCTTYKLYNWNGYGSWYSHQTGGVWGKIQNSSHQTIQWIGPDQSNTNYNFAPAYYVVPC